MRTSRTGWVALLGALALLAGPVGVAHAVDPGTDLVYALDEIDAGSGFGVAGMVAGEVDQKHTDVRGGFVKRAEGGTVTFGWQLGEPDKIVRKNDKLAVAQSGDIAVYLAVQSSTPVAVDETVSARVKKCAAKAIFRRDLTLPLPSTLPDTGKWKIECSKGWQKAFEGLSEDAIAALKTVMEGSEFKVKAEGLPGDRADVPAEIDAIPFL